MPRMRNIEQAYLHIKEHDPDSALTPHALRQMVRSGKIPACRSGNKYLLDIDQLDSYFTNESFQQSKPVDSGAIRVVRI